MKRFTQTLAIAVGCTFMSSMAMAQTKSLYLSSVNGTKVSQYDGQTRNVTMYRNVYNGWNTLCVPFDLSVEELNAAFGDACKLEALKSVDADNGTLYLNFADVKAAGVKANTPYLLYYTGENKTVKVTAQEAEVKYSADPTVSFSAAGAVVKFTGTQSHVKAEGQYGIYVRDNADANFSVVDSETTGFYATRCFITVEGINGATLVSRHDGDATAIKSVGSTDENGANVYDINGVRQNGLQKGVNVVGGKKVYKK